MYEPTWARTKTLSERCRVGRKKLSINAIYEVWIYNIIAVLYLSSFDTSIMVKYIEEKNFDDRGVEGCSRTTERQEKTRTVVLLTDLSLTNTSTASQGKQRRRAHAIYEALLLELWFG